MPARSYYVVLGVSRRETLAGIRAAYHELTQRMHPDIAGASGTTGFQEIDEAYEALSDPQRRREHDRQFSEADLGTEVTIRRWPPRWPVAPEPISLFQPEQTRPSFEAFEERYLRNFRGWRPKAESAEGLTLDVALTPAEAFHGCTIPVGVPVFGPCPECSGTGQIFPFRCTDCAGSGASEGQRTLYIRVPPQIRNGEILETPLDMFGIDNLYLRVHVSISDEY